MTTQTQQVDHKAVLTELNGLAPDMSELGLEAPRHIETGIAAQHAWRLRNTYVQSKISQRLARLRGATKEAQAIGQQMNAYLKDIVELYRLYPEARELVKQLDKAPAEEQPAEEAAS